MALREPDDVQMVIEMTMPDIAPHIAKMVAETLSALSAALGRMTFTFGKNVFEPQR